jgi:NADH dehydrogenase [ubiquinone] 1 alpha subcomplex assembly factor 7
MIELPERLDGFMARANTAYYTSHDPFADFTTAPEIAQMFGEVLGAWAAVCWRMMDRPAPILLVEAGPGRGTLMADALRPLPRVAPEFRTALRLHLIETSPRLRETQAAVLPGATWHDSLATLPDGPILLIANEFLDALPIRQFVGRAAQWLERWVAGGAWVELPTADPPKWPAAEGTVIERGEAAGGWIAALARRLAIQGGAALLLDYGPRRSAPGDSLQGLRAGARADPLGAPGETDLTAHVDFEALAAAAGAQGAAVHGPIPQGALLERLGFYVRTQRLARTLPPASALALMDAAHRLAQPERMGALFKAMAICHPALPAPPGFEP